MPPENAWTVSSGPAAQATFILVILAFVITPLPLATVQTWPAGCVARWTEYTPLREEVRVNLNAPLANTDSESVSLLISIRLPPERPDTVPPTEKEAELLPPELDEPPPQPVSCKVKRLIRIKPKSFVTSLLIYARSFIAISKRENCLALAKRPGVAVRLPICHPARTDSRISPKCSQSPDRSRCSSYGKRPRSLVSEGPANSGHSSHSSASPSYEGRMLQ